MAYTPKKLKSPILRFWIITLFPETVVPYITSSIIGRAVGTNYISVDCVSPRDYATDKHKTVDDRPYGGGPGMVMSALPILQAVKSVQSKIKRRKNAKILILLTSPGGQTLTNELADSWLETQYTDIIILCGRYEGIDSRVAQILGASAVSIGDYVMTGGELAAMVMIDVVTRRIPGVLGDNLSVEELRTSSHIMYTRPSELQWQDQTYSVPEVIKNGNHAEIEKWKKEGINI
jgi:tRNA (guanine37-N1)-methyltransferase